MTETTKSESSGGQPSSETGSGGVLAALREHAMVKREAPNDPAVAAFADLRPGDQLTVTVGASNYSPVSYNSFTVGPFTARVELLAGETAVDAYIRGRRELLAIEQAEYEAALEKYFDRLLNNDRVRKQRQVPRKAD